MCLREMGAKEEGKKEEKRQGQEERERGGRKKKTHIAFSDVKGSIWSQFV